MRTYCFSNRKDAKLLLLGTEGKISTELIWDRWKNLYRVDMTFYTLINYFRKLILYFSFTIPHKVSSFQGFCLLLWTANLRNNSLLGRTISITCIIPCQIFIAPFFFFTGVVLGRDFRGQWLLWIFLQNPRSDKWRIYLSVKLHGEVCLAACLNKIKVLKGKHFSVTLSRI